MEELDRTLSGVTAIAHDHFRRLLEAAPDAMVIAHESGAIALVNVQAERLFGYDREELLGKQVEVLIPERFRARHPSYRREYATEPRARPMGAGGLALFGRRRDGSEFPAEISLSPLEVDGGLWVITAIRDMTERKRAEEERAKLLQAQEALRLRDEFLSIVSHELKTPLSALVLQLQASERLLEGTPEAEVKARFLPRLERSRSAAHRLSQLIERLLDLSRITAGRLQLDPQPVELGALIERVAAELEDALEQSGSALDLDLPPSPVRGVWDPLRLEQVVTNVLSNAIKYGAGKPITIVLEDAPELVRLSVHDEGIGIKPEDQERIFERFERVVRDRNYTGLGLGLWIVRQIVEAHGGHIDVRSAPGAGTTFDVELPKQRST